MEAEVIKSFLPDLVTAISDCVQPVSDHCLAKGLIPDSVYKRVLESGCINEDKARILILAVKTSAETDGRGLEILLNILEEQLPNLTKNKLLPNIRKVVADKAKAVVSSPQNAELEKRIKDLEHKLEKKEKERKFIDVKANTVDAIPPDILKPIHLKYLTAFINTDRWFWHNLGSQLGFSSSELDDIQRKVNQTSGEDSADRHMSFDQGSTEYARDSWNMYFVEEILRRWLHSYPGDSRGSTSFATYSKLKTALVKARVGDIARDLPPYEHFQESHHSNTK